MEDFRQRLVEENFKDIFGQESVKRQVKSALLTRRNIILVGPPGVGKTTLAKSVASILPSKEVNDCPYHCDPKRPICSSCREKAPKTITLSSNDRFIRIQGSPELTAEDLIGDIDPIKALKYGPLDIRAFTPGKIFKANNKILFFDEINRCSEKLQNSLLQVLEEKRATISSYDVDIESDFIFIGTMNPGDISTETLSDVFLDRFDLIYMDYPESEDIERRIVLVKGEKVVEYPSGLLSFTVNFVRLLRKNEDLEKVPSVRATIGLYERAQANAFLSKRKKVTLEDIESAAFSVLAHRIRLKPSVKYLKKPEEILRDEFKDYLAESEASEEGDAP